jgi:hypothetical protein
MAGRTWAWEGLEREVETGRGSRWEWVGAAGKRERLRSPALHSSESSHSACLLTCGRRGRGEAGVLRWTGRGAVVVALGLAVWYACGWSWV